LLVTVSGYTVGFAVMTAVALLRQPGIAPTRTMWAEDGAIFYSQAMKFPLWHTLVTAYNGYDQFVPRLAVQLTRLAPVRDATGVIALSGALGLAALGCSVFYMARAHLPSVGLRVLLAGSMVMLPVAVVEMLDNLVNLPWWMFFAAFWALLWRPQTAFGRLLAGALLALAAASEPLVAILVPLAVLRAVVLRQPKENAAGIGLLVGLAYQAAVVLAANGEHSLARGDLVSVLPAFGARVGLGWLTGMRATNALVGSSRALTEGFGVAVFVAVFVASVVLGSPRVRVFALVSAVLAPICFVVPVWLRGVGPLVQTSATVGYAGRYAAVPTLMVISAVLVLAGHLSGRPRLSRRGQKSAGFPYAALVCCALLLPAWVADFRDANRRMDGPTWQSQLTLATAACRDEKPGVWPQLDIAPPGVHFWLPCRTVAARGDSLEVPAKAAGPAAPEQS
jgi:hypothetical protein